MHKEHVGGALDMNRRERKAGCGGREDRCEDTEVVGRGEKVKG